MTAAGTDRLRGDMCIAPAGGKIGMICAARARDGTIAFTGDPLILESCVSDTKCGIPALFAVGYKMVCRRRRHGACHSCCAP